MPESRAGGNSDREGQRPGALGALTSAAWWQKIWQVLFLSAKDFANDSGPQWAAAIAYYTLLSVFPLLLAVASIGAYFVDEQWAINQATQLLGQFLPEGEREIEAIVEEAIEARAGVSLISVPLLLWSGSRVFSIVTIALNIAFDVDEQYGFLKRTLVEMGMLASLGLLFILALAGRWLIPWLIDTLQALPVNEYAVLQLALDLAPGALLLVAFFLTYKFVPRRAVDWRAALPGAVLATALLLAARPLFTGYVEGFADYNLIYGSLGVLVVLIIWTWIMAMILLFGGEVVAHLQMMLIEGVSAEEVERRHKLRSPIRKAEMKALLLQEERARPVYPAYEEQYYVWSKTTEADRRASLARRALLAAGTLLGALLLWKVARR